MKFGLKENIISQIKSVFEEFPQVKEVIIYGSRAIGNYRKGSDIDFTITGAELSHELLNSIRLKLDELFLPYIFDLSDFKKINNKDLIEHIGRIGKPFYEKQETKAGEFYARTLI